MKTREFLSLTLLIAASATTLLTAGVANAELAQDAKAHKACLERFESVARDERLALKAQPSYEAAGPGAGEYHYYFNASERGEGDRDFRVECEANRVGRVTYFAIEPGRWRFETPQETGFASR